MSIKYLLKALLVTFTIIVIFFYFTKHQQSKKNLETKELNPKIENINSNEGMIEGIQYVYKDKSNYIYNITAELGQKQSAESDVFKLYKVYALLEFNDKEKLEIWADEATYNTFNNFTNFKNNVLLRKEKDKIICNNLELDFIEGFAYLKDKVEYTNGNTKMLVDIISINLKNKTTRLNMFTEEKKVKLIFKDEIN